MTAPLPRRKVTRAFVLTLAAFTTVLGISMVIAAWGLEALLTNSKPVEADLPFFVAPVIFLPEIALLFFLLWRAALATLRGHSGPPWTQMLLVGLGAYLIWAVLGSLSGFSLRDAWMSVYVLSLVIIWMLSVFIFWILLARQVYTERPTPSWPWEQREQREREQDP